MSYQPGQPAPPAPAYAPPQTPAPGEFTQYSVHPISTRRSGFDAGKFWRSLGRLGQICLLCGLILFLSFFLDWFNTKLTCMGSACDNPGVSQLLNQGFGASFSSAGFAITGSAVTYRSTNDFRGTGNLGNFIESYNFPLLWVVLLGSIALILLPIALAQGRLSARRGHVLILLVVGAALLVEVIYAFSAAGALPLAKANATTLNVVLASNVGPATMYLATGVDVGFWVGLLATLLVGSAYLLAALFANQAAPRAAVASPQQAAQHALAQPGARRRPEQ